MAKAVNEQRKSRRTGSRTASNSSMDDVLKDADRLLEMVMGDSPPVDPTQTGQRPHKQRATVADHTHTSGERRRRSSSPLEKREALKKSKKSFEDDGSRSLDDDDNASSKDHTKSKLGGRHGEKTSTRGRAPCLAIGRAPLAVPEDSTVTPDVCPKMGLLKFQSMGEADDDDDVDGAHGLNVAEDDYDDVDGDEDPDAEKEKVLSEIALKLRDIGDRVNIEVVPGTMSKSASTLSISMLAIDGIQDLLSNLTYEEFQKVVNRNMGDDPGVQQVAVVFRLARAAVQKLGNGTPGAFNLKRIAFDYFRNNVASWVSQNGGWEGVAASL